MSCCHSVRMYRWPNGIKSSLRYISIKFLQRSSLLSRGTIRNVWYINKGNLRDSIAATGLVISNWIPIVDFSARVTLKFDGWPRKTIGHFLYTTTSFVHHFHSIDEVKIELQSGNAQIGSKLVIFLSCVTLKLDGWPWKTIGHLFYSTFSFVHHFKAIDQFKLELQSGNSQFGSKSEYFCPMWPRNFTDDLEKQ